MISYIGCRHAIAGRLCKSASRDVLLASVLVYYMRSAQKIKKSDPERKRAQLHERSWARLL